MGKGSVGSVSHEVGGSANGKTQPPGKKPRRSRGRRDPIDLHRDIAWAYQNLDTDPDALLAPSAGARELLRLGRDDPALFLKRFVAKLVTPESGKGRDNDLPHEDEPDDGRNLLAEIMAKHKPKEERAAEESTTAPPLPPPVVALVQPDPEPTAPAPTPAPVSFAHPDCPYCKRDGDKALRNCACCAYIRFTERPARRRSGAG
jgi:hypothetical protein